jgi:hypothetical protein
MHSMSKALSWIQGLARHEFLIMLVWSLWLAFPYFAFGHNSYVRLHDCGDCDLPFAMAEGRWIANFKYCLWNALLLTGVDSFLSGDPPLKLDVFAFALLPPWVAYGSITWLQRFVCGYFTVRLARDALLSSRLTSIFAGMFCSMFAQAWANNSWNGFTLYDLLNLPGIPFILWAVSRLDPKKLGSYVIALALGALLSFCANYYLSVFSLGVVVWWFLAVTPKTDRRFWTMILVFLTGFLLMEFPVLWAACTSAPLSHRAHWTHFAADNFITRSLGYRRLVISLVQFVGDNVVPILLMAVSVAVTRHLPRRALPFVTASLAIVACEVLWVALLPLFEDRLGFLVGFNFDRFSLYIPYFFAFCGAICADSLVKDWTLGLISEAGLQRTWKLKCLLMGMALVAVSVQSVIVQAHTLMAMAQGNTFANFYRHPAFQFVAAKKDEGQPFRVATIAEGFEDCPHAAFAWAYDLESVDGYLGIYSRRYQEYWGRVLLPLTTKNELIRRYFWTWGCRVYLFSPAYFFPAHRQAPNFGALAFADYYNLNLLALANTKYVITPVPLDNKNLRLVLSPTDKQIAWRFNPSRFEKLVTLVTGESPGFALYVYENTLVRPRFSLLGKSLVFQNEDKLLKALETADHETMSSCAFVVESDVKGLPVRELGGKQGNVSVRDYSFDTICLRLDAEAPSILFAANCWSPYWKVWVDGVETPLFPVNHAFQGVYCPQGPHEITLRYLPPWAVDAVGKRVSAAPKE